MIRIYLKAIAVIAPGLKNWHAAKQVLTGKCAYEFSKVEGKLTTMLAPNENRRCSRTTQLALSAIQQLLEQHSFNSHEIRYVFTSCNGDLSIFHHISTALSQPGRPVSPIKFHNSVHNAPAGYAAIALHSQQPSTSISAYKDSFANGLLEAAVQSSLNKQDCLLCGYDEVPPEPLLSLFPMESDFSYALLLSNQEEHALCALDISTSNDGAKATSMDDVIFEQLRQSNPQAKILPLLHALANKYDKTLYFNNNQQQIVLRLRHSGSVLHFEEK